MVFRKVWNHRTHRSRIRITGFESYNTLAALEVLHLSTNARECLNDTRSRFFGSRLCHVSVRIYPSLDNVRSDYACVSGMASRGGASAESRGVLVKLSFRQSKRLMYNVIYSFFFWAPTLGVFRYTFTSAVAWRQ